MASQTRLPMLDPLRGLAIALVYGYHAMDLWHPVSAIEWQGLWRVWPDNIPWWAVWLSSGWIGVSLFFVISGFCIHLSYQQSARSTPWAGFFTRRLFRLYPPYLVVFAGLWLLAALRHHSVSPASLVSHLGLLHNAWPHTIYDLNASFWSIAVEWQLYLLYPVLLMLTRYTSWSFSLSIAAVCELGLQAWPGLSQMGLLSHEPGILTHSPLAYWFSWSLGAALADAYLNKRPILLERWQKPLWLVLSVAGLTFRPLYSAVFMYVALFTASCLASLLFEPQPAQPVFRLPGWLYRHLAFVGVISYSVYLIHQPVISLLPWWLRSMSLDQMVPAWMLFVASIVLWPVVLGLGWLLYRWLEVPSQAFAKCASQRFSKAASFDRGERGVTLTTL